MEQPSNDHDIIYALRTVHQNQAQLNLLADQKANILIGLIIIPITFLLTRQSQFNLNDKEMWIVVAILALETVSLIFAMLVIRPRTKWKRYQGDIKEIPNVLFFGFFTAYPEKHYVDHIQQSICDNASARKALTKDIYQIGHVLQRKYKLLNIAYLFATTGVLLAMGGIIFAMVLT